jgi:hypothetical protein
MGSMMRPRLLGVLALCTVPGCAPSATGMASPPVDAVSESGGLKLLELTRIESSPAAGSLSVRVANGSLGALLLGIDVRAEPGMWLGPSLQETPLFYIHMGGSDSARASLARFDSRAGRFLTVYALRGMLRPEQLDAVVDERDRAVTVLSRMLGVRPPSGLTLVFYPDGSTKALDTHRVGAGMTNGRFIVEVINDSVRVDPYHELAHVISGQVGRAPPWLNEGFAEQSASPAA